MRAKCKGQREITMFTCYFKHTISKEERIIYVFRSSCINRNQNNFYFLGHFTNW